MTSTLRQWLADRTETELAGIIARRPDVLVPYAPKTYADLADRLHRQQSLSQVLNAMPVPCLDLLETLLVFGAGGMTRAELAATLDLPESDNALGATLATCELWAIAWESGGRIWIPGALRALCPAPLRLGPPVIEFLNGRTVDDLGKRAMSLGLITTVPKAIQRKADLLSTLSRFYADGDAIRALAAQAPVDQRKRLMVGAERNPIMTGQASYYYAGMVDPALAWLVNHGLVVNDWQHTLIPREVGIALRGPGWHPTLSSRPPTIPTVPIKGTPDAATAVSQDAASAASAAIEQLAAVVEACGGAPAGLLKTGGVGVREIRRLGKTAGVPEGPARLWLEIAYAADLVDVDADELVPTPHYDEWLALTPSRRLALLIDAWLGLSTVPLMDQRPEGVPVRAALMPDEYAAVAAELRREVLGIAAALPPGEALDPSGASTADKSVSGPASTPLAAALTWLRPVVCDYLQNPAYAGDAIWAEATALGLIGRGALSPLGRTLNDVAGDASMPDATKRARLDEAAKAFVHDATAEAIFQADLTIVVPGSPAAPTARLLDSVADRESRGAAGTWRCSPESVRRALDAGETANGILDALRAIAVGGTLPQPLEYLVADVARRHGTLRARTVGCVLRADDPALLAEIAAGRSLSALRLSLLAPTVLASALPLDRTLAALRAAGYTPVGESADGTALVERPTQRRSAPRAHVLKFHARDPYDAAGEPGYAVRHRGRGGVPMSPAAVAKALIEVGDADEAGTRPMVALSKPSAKKPGIIVGPPPQRLPNAPVRIPTLRTVQQSASLLSAEEQHILAQAIDNGRPIEIGYTDGDGHSTRRVIEPAVLEGCMLSAWCRLRKDDREFHLGRIDAVRPVH